MKKHKLVKGLLSLFFVLNLVACSTDDLPENGIQTSEEVTQNLQDGEVALVKSTGGNPIAKVDEYGKWKYGGDPSVLVDGDTVYLYTGHDTSTDSDVDRAIYVIREYVCYSTKDLVNWKSEGTVMTASVFDIKWATGSTTAWASQVAKHYDKKAGKDMYYLYFCTWDKTSAGKQSIGVAVSDSPTGPFEDIGEPLVKGTLTEPQSNNWNDIDPTIWIEKDSEGVEHRYLAWGNSRYYVCELNEDMISVRDLNGDGEITCGQTPEEADVLDRTMSGFTEAPWLYRRQDESGDYYGDYYLFYANGWREKLAYCTTDNILTGTYKFGKVLMPPTATSNTNHPAIFDFKGNTYMAYHNGSLPAGNGYRRSACITKLHFNEDGSVEEVPETVVGLDGITSYIKTMDDKNISHVTFTNASSDNMYPYTNMKIGVEYGKEELDSQWVLCEGKADAANAAYVSIQAENKPGLYITANEDKTVTLAQDVDASDDTAKTQTFRTVKGLSEEDAVSFESVSQPGMYLTVVEDALCLTDGTEKKAATFNINLNK